MGRCGEYCREAVHTTATLTCRVQRAGWLAAVKDVGSAFSSLAGLAVDSFADQVGMAVVPGVLADELAEVPPQATAVAGADGIRLWCCWIRSSAACFSRSHAAIDSASIDASASMSHSGPSSVYSPHTQRRSALGPSAQTAYTRSFSVR
jgi:hypothetical protein